MKPKVINPLLKDGVETNAALDKTLEVAEMTEKALCVLCDHYRICGFYLAVVPLVENYPIGRDKSPIRAEDLAQICLDFKPFDVRVSKEVSE